MRVWYLRERRYLRRGAVNVRQTSLTIVDGDTPLANLLRLLRSFEIQTIFRWTGWLLAASILILSVVPASTRPVTPVGHDFEHILIFFVTGLAFGLGYWQRIGFLLFATPAFAAAIEIAQFWFPSRHARLSDFIVDSLAACLGVAGGYALSRVQALVLRG